MILYWNIYDVISADACTRPTQQPNFIFWCEPRQNNPCQAVRNFSKRVVRKVTCDIRDDTGSSSPWGQMFWRLHCLLQHNQQGQTGQTGIVAAVWRSADDDERLWGGRMLLVSRLDLQLGTLDMDAGCQRSVYSVHLHLQKIIHVPIFPSRRLNLGQPVKLGTSPVTKPDWAGEKAPSRTLGDNSQLTGCTGEALAVQDMSGKKAAKFQFVQFRPV